jgi:hypothetical protein
VTTQLEGPRFGVRTWRETTPAGRHVWFARLVPVRPEAAPFGDEARAVSTAPDEPAATLAVAVVRAIAMAKWTALWGADER